MTQSTPTACPVCLEPAHGHHGECPGMQTGGAMLDALLATRKACHELCEIVEDSDQRDNALKVLCWPKIPLKDL